MIDKINQLHSFLEKYLEWISYVGGGGGGPSLPEMELYPDDYLAFAEENIERYFSSKRETAKMNELISCLSNLKRALDSQIECFLFCYGISNYSKKKNLSSPQKLQFISDIGIFSSRTIERFINLRNKIEHEFKKPLVADIEALYDLVVAFVALLKNSINAYSLTDPEFYIYNSDDLLVGDFYCSYIKDPLKITYEYMIFNKPSGEDLHSLSAEESQKIIANSQQVTLEASIDELDAFTYFFRCLLILMSHDSYSNWEHVKNKINPNQSKT
jgi:hypothetical protein